MLSLMPKAIAVLLAAAGPTTTSEHATAVEQQVMLGSDYLHYHRDLRFRLQGMTHLEAGEGAEAHADFLRAARFADKASQAMVAEQLWQGDGVAQDRALAYVWMDLAAERAYPAFIAYRENYWHAMTAEERASAIARGAAVFAEYGDAVAKRRLEHMMRKKRSTFIDSRVGNVARGSKIFMISPDTGLQMQVPRDQVLARKFWHAHDYFQWQDTIWERPLQGIVEVGPLRGEQSDTPAPPDTPR